jgi:hypothetical protein
MRYFGSFRHQGPILWFKNIFAKTIWQKWHSLFKICTAKLCKKWKFQGFQDKTQILLAENGDHNIDPWPVLSIFILTSPVPFSFFYLFPPEKTVASNKLSRDEISRGLAGLAWADWQKNFTPKQDCQMVCFQTRNPILVKFGVTWNRKCCNILWLLEYFTAFWYNLQPFGIVCGHLVYFSVLVCLDQEKSGNPAPK